MSSFVQALKSATQEDLDHINERLAELESEVSYLKSARKLLMEKFVAKEVGSQVKQSAQGVKMARTKELRRKLLAMLDAAGTAQKKAVVVQTLSLEYGEFEHLTKHSW